MPSPVYDLLIKNVRVVRPNGNTVHASDIAIQGDSVARVAPGIDAQLAKSVYDGGGKLAFPGVVDAHMHSGIYSPLEEDAISESKAAAVGGVTSSLNYFRTGQYYLNKGGPYAKFFPEVLKIAKGRFHVDYGFHLAPMDRKHIDEIPMLVDKHGVASFKIFMFYGSHGLHGASDAQREFLMIGDDERYDLAHFEFIMRGIQRAREAMPERAQQISLSLHCETAEIMTAYTRLVEKDKSLRGLAAYSAARPQHSEGLAVFIASYLAHETALPNINLLHLSSRKAVQAALMMADVFPHIDFKREVTIGHLMLDVTSKAAELAKVNPPIRPREDVEFLWQALLAGELDWVVSDHACCRHETKIPKRYFGNIWMAKSGFGGTEYLLPALVSEGTRRGMDYNHMARVLSWNPAQRFGLNRKGDIAEGFDADIALVDPSHTWTIRAGDSPSTQGYTPFEGLELSAHVDATFLRGRLISENGQVLGKPQGRYLHRPTA
ncbi:MULTISPECIES: dihydroorotase [Ramlibacter]|uniref:Amidohydrolase family protein n=1 Tax=Ramlibacter pinisoli TaxID=2682844 RepID=A0A6N8ITX2_9BURK|nr:MULTISPECIES: dihydroorotase family protein [Ramlibacter]MBA2965343.1 dihydroorotase family protein [Ramlibacter sp. CGMCC 1.13660]MVQ30307.1 amidohydrolase family protein [Ramlibacter pinisoli]